MQLKSADEKKGKSLDDFISEAGKPNHIESDEPKKAASKKRVNIILTPDEISLIDQACEKESQKLGMPISRQAFMKSIIMQRLLNTSD